MTRQCLFQTPAQMFVWRVEMKKKKIVTQTSDVNGFLTDAEFTN